MNAKERDDAYLKYVEARIPRTKAWPSLFNSFWVGGVICMLGQGTSDLLIYLFPSMSQQSANTFASIFLIFLASFLTGLGIYDKIGKFAGGGSIIPITGFSNSIASPAMEYKNEGIIFGMCVKMFTIAGPVIVTGVVASIIVGLIYLFL